MQEKKYNFLLLDGYVLKKRVSKIKVDTALKLLKGKKQYRFAKAERDDKNNTVLLTQHYVECPHCLNRLPAYAHFINPQFSINKRVFDVVKNEKVEQWASRQISMFGENKTLEFNPFIEPSGKYTCPYCNKSSMPYKTTRQAEVSFKRGKLNIISEIINLIEIPVLPYIARNDAVSFPIFERLTFNLKKGKVFVTVYDNGGNVYIKRDVTKYPNILSGDAVNTVLKADFRVRKAVKKLLGLKSDNWLSMERLIDYTRFTDFPDSFYYAIPYITRETVVGDAVIIERTVEESFKKTSKRLKDPDSAIAFYEKSGMPSLKAVRRMFFTNSGLLFYLRECRILFETVDDVNCFLRLLRSDGIFQMLSDLNSRPRTEEFFKEYASVVSAPVFCDKVIEKWHVLFAYATEYAAFNENVRRREKTKWTNDYFEQYRSRPDYSVPMRLPHRDIIDTFVDGFEFSAVKNSEQVYKLGQALNNCLVSWHIDGNPVIAVLQNNKAVGAIEVVNKTVKQRRTKDNGDFSDIPVLLAAYNKWKERFDLKENLYNFDDIPF